MLFLRRMNNRAGMSLIEILVALVIFLVGILSVVRMFPGGFVVVKQSENVTLAKHLAQAEIERWKDRAANLPAGILPWGWDPNANGGAGDYAVLPDTDPDDLRDPVEPPGGWPAGYDIRYFTDVNKFRYIHAEATEIPAPTPVFPPSSIWQGDCSIYVLGFSPVETGSILVYSGPMRRRTLRDTQYLNLRSTADYAIDYAQARIYVKSDPLARDLVITYSYWNDSGTEPALIPVVNQPIAIPAGDDYYDLPQPAGFRGIEPGSDSLHRAFTIKPVADWSQDNPYEYEIINEEAGVIAFNPYGYGYDEDTARGKMPLVANIDYRVENWHIISEEREATDSDVKLSLRFIKKAGETQEYDGTTYAGLAAFPMCSVLAVDMDTGVVYADSDPAPAAFTFNYKEGTILFDSSLIGHKFRISYQAENDWAVQVYKAFDVYNRSYVIPDAADPNTLPDHRQYYVDGNTIGFSRCNALRSVAVDYVYNDGSQKTVSGQVFQIPDRSSGVGSLYYIELPPTGAILVKVSKVRGVTFGARVIWRDSGRGLRAGKWKKADLQTYLTRK